jgi:hypothetical protein
MEIYNDVCIQIGNYRQTMIGKNEFGAEVPEQRQMSHRKTGNDQHKQRLHMSGTFTESTVFRW